MKTRMFVSMLAVGFICCGTIGTAQASLKAFSVNITDAVTQSGAGLIGANTAGVDGYGNWNDFYNGLASAGLWQGDTFTAIGTLKLSDGTSAGNIQIRLKRGPSFEQADSTVAAMTGGSAGDKALMAGGPRTYIAGFSNTSNSTNIRMEIIGLNSVFTSGYEVRSYQDKMGNNNAGNGTVWVSPNAADYAIGETNTTGFNTAGTTSGNYSMNSAAFDGNFATNGHYLNIAAPAGSPDHLVLTNQMTFYGVNGQFAQSVWTGIQIVGEVADPPSGTPEPTSAVLALLGVVGMMFTGRRRKRS